MALAVPLVGRLSPREYVAVVLGFLFIALESVLRIIIFFLPRQVIAWFHEKSKSLFHTLTSDGSKPRNHPEWIYADKIRRARDFGELCALQGYSYEEHVVMTKDGYLLGLHRLPAKKGQMKKSPGTANEGGMGVVYMHHGLLMNSEIWVCLTEEERCLPFVLVEQGFDVWLGNNRGNKYSKKSIHHSPNSTKFWDFSIDDFAWHDIPDSIEYILDTTGALSLSYIGFSQGTAQAFASLGIHPSLNRKVDVFVALAPAMSPKGLAAPIVDGLMKASPTLMYLFFGRKAILSSTVYWKQILYPGIFSKAIDASLGFLFDWRSVNIDPLQKLAAYSHLYSFASVKSVVHWFQIMRNAAFTMYDDDESATNPSMNNSNNSSYHPVRFPTKNIVTPIVLLYGDSDSLVDIEVMMSELPESTTVARRLRTYEHLDVIWGKNVNVDVIPEVVRALKRYSRKEGEIHNDRGVRQIPSSSSADLTLKGERDGMTRSDYI